MTGFSEVQRARGSSRLPSLYLLGLLMAIDAIAIDCYLPAMPQIGMAFAAPAEQVQLTLVGFFFGVAGGQLVWGPVSDRIGRRPPVLAGLLIYTLAAVGAVAAPGMVSLILARFFQGAGASAGLVIGRAIVSDCWSEREASRLYSILMQILGFTSLISPLMGGAFLLIGSWRVIFLVLAAVGVGSLIWTLIALAESHPGVQGPSAGKSATFSGFGTLLNNRAFVRASLASAFAMATMFALIAGASFVFIEQFGWTSTQYSLLYGATSVAFIGVSYVNTAALRRRDAAELMRWGVRVQFLLAIAFCAAALLKIGGDGLLAILMVGLMGILGIILGNSVSIAMAQAPANLSGTASALLGVLQFLISSLLLPFAGSGALPSISVGIANAGAALITLLLMRRSG